MSPATLPSELSQKRYCPTCGSASSIANSIDTWAVFLECPAGHRFSIEPRTPSSESRKAARASFPELEGSSPKSVARFWLTEPRARSILNAQLAQLLRAVVDDRSARVCLALQYCPLCAGVLDDVPHAPSSEVACSNRHGWRRYSWQLARDGQSCEDPYVLWAEHDRVAIGRLIAMWLQRDPATAHNLHESVERALRDSQVATRDEH